MDLYVRLCRVHSRADTGGTLAVAKSVPTQTEKITVGSSSAPSTISVPADQSAIEFVWLLKAVGGACHVACGAAPAADADGPWHISDGEEIAIGVSAPGERVAAIQAA